MLRFYDLDFNFLGETNSFTSLQFERKWYGFGGFELHINKNTALNSRPPITIWDKVYETITTPTKELIALIDNDPKKAYIISADNGSFAQNGKASENLVLKGVELKYLTHRALTYPSSGQIPYTITDNVETVIKEIIRLNQGTGAAADRQLAALEIETDAGQGAVITKSTLYQPLDIELEKIAMENDCGWWYGFDISTQKIKAYFSLGTDRTRGQSVVPPCIFDQYTNLETGEYSHNDNNYYNVLIAEGKPETGAVTSYIKAYGSGIGTRRREVYKQFDNTVYVAGSPFRDLDSSAAQYLARLDQELYVQGKPLTNGNMQYERDFWLGDLVVVQAFDLTSNKRITGIKEIIEADKQKRIEVVFEKELPTLPQKLKTRLNDIERVI
jgi:hypothetical protein